MRALRDTLSARGHGGMVDARTAESAAVSALAFDAMLRTGEWETHCHYSARRSFVARFSHNDAVSVVKLQVSRISYQT